MKTVNNFKQKLLQLKLNSSEIEVHENKLSFVLFKSFDGRLLSIKTIVQFDHNNEVNVYSYVTNGSNAKDRKFAKEYSTFVVESLL